MSVNDWKDMDNKSYKAYCEKEIKKNVIKLFIFLFASLISRLLYKLNTNEYILYVLVIFKLLEICTFVILVNDFWYMTDIIKELLRRLSD